MIFWTEKNRPIFFDIFSPAGKNSAYCMQIQKEVLKNARKNT